MWMAPASSWAWSGLLKTERYLNRVLELLKGPVSPKHRKLEEAGCGGVFDLGGSLSQALASGALSQNGISHFCLSFVCLVSSRLSSPSSGPSPPDPPPSPHQASQGPSPMGTGRDDTTMGPWGHGDMGGEPIGERWGTKHTADIPPGRWPTFLGHLGSLGQGVC